MIVPLQKIQDGKRLYRLIVNGQLIAVGTLEEIKQIIIEL